MRMLTGCWTSLEPAKENGSMRPYSDMMRYVILRRPMKYDGGANKSDSVGYGGRAGG